MVGAFPQPQPPSSTTTMIAAKAGPKRAGSPNRGETDTSGIRGHVSAGAKTKNPTSGWRLTKAVMVLRVVPPRSGYSGTIIAAITKQTKATADPSPRTTLTRK